MFIGWVLILSALLATNAAAQSCPVAAPGLSNSVLSSVCNVGGAAAASPACTIFRLCFSSNLRPRPYPNICSMPRIAATLCLDDADIVAQVPGCASYAAKKDTILANPTCKNQLGYFSIFSTSSTTQAAGLNCAMMGGAGSMPGCDLCPSPQNCQDPLWALGAGCAYMPMSGCNNQPSWSDFCAKDAAGPNGEFGLAAAYLCLVSDQAAQVPEMLAPSPAPAPLPFSPLAPTPSPRVPTPAPLTVPAHVHAPVQHPAPSPLLIAAATAQTTPTAPSITTATQPSMAPMPAMHMSNAGPVVTSAPTPAPITAPVPAPVQPTAATAPVPAPVQPAAATAPAPAPALPIAVITTAPITSMPTTAGASAFPSLDACITDPTNSACGTYTYSAANINQDIGHLCAAMGDMPGCMLQAACNAGQVQNKQWCEPTMLLATLCNDMPSMSGCKNFLSMCRPGSTVAQCAVGKGVPNFPTYTTARTAIFAICGNHFMDQCADCSQTGACPDPLGTLVSMCSSMPTMPECATTISPMCAATAADGGGLTPYCSEDGDVTQDTHNPSMLMFFHQRYNEFILWKSWVPINRTQYGGAVVVVLLFGIISTWLKIYAACLGLAWRADQAARLVGQRNTCGSYVVPSGRQCYQNTVKGLISAVSVCLDYFNMLVAMTYNTGLFIAVVMGYMLGTLLLSHIPENYAAHLANQRRPSDSNMSGVGCKVDHNDSERVTPVKGAMAKPAAEEDLTLVPQGECHSCCPGPL